MVTAGILFVIALFWKPAAPACVAGIGALLTVAAARENRFLLGTALLAFGVRTLVAVALHWIAALELPVLRALQTAPVDGYRFWILAPDATWYHASAVAAVIAWEHGTEFPTGSGPEYFIFTAIAYRLFGANPLNAVLWNALFGALSVVAGYRIAARLAGPSAARPAALLIALWPSAVLWSSQLLKDAACLWLILLLLYLTMRAVEPPLPAASRWQALARWAGLLLVLFAASLAMHRFRYYILLVLIPAPAVFVVHALIRRTRGTAWHVVTASAVMAVMFLGVSASRRMDLERIFAPRYPAIGHFNLGVTHQSRGDLDAAQTHYDRALALSREYPPALKQLGTIAVARQDRSKAIAYFERYLAREPGDVEVRTVLDALLQPKATVAVALDTRIQPADVVRHSPPRRERTEEARAEVRAPGPSEAKPPPTEVARRERADEVPAEVRAPGPSEAKPPPTEVARGERAAGVPAEAKAPGPSEAKSPPTEVARGERAAGVPAEAKAPGPSEAERQPTEIARREGTDDVPAEVKGPGPSEAERRPAEIARREPTDGVPVTAMPERPSGVALPPALIPRQVPVPPEPFEITGPGSDYRTGKRAMAYGNVVAALQRTRAGFTRSGAHSTIDADVEFHSYGDIVRYLPRAVLNVLLTPYPWQWFDVGGGTGAFKALSAVEALLLYALIVPLIAGLAVVVRRGSPDALYLAVFVVATTLLLGFVITSLGTLFRLRLESLLPLFTAGGLGWTWLRHGRRRRT
jgi:tetratricopeptide (TPR) repeat protein